MEDHEKTRSQLIEELERLRRSGSAEEGEEGTGGEWADKILKIQRDLAVKLSGTRGLQETLQAVLDGILQATGLDSGGIYLLDKQTGDLDIAYDRGFTDAFMEETTHYDAGSPNVNLVNAGEPVYVEYEKFDVPKTEAEREEGLKVIAVVPLKTEGEVIGCVNVASHQLEEIPERSREVIEILAGQVGRAVSHSRLITAIHESEERYRLFFDNAGDAFFSYGGDLVINEVNPRMKELTGYEEEDFVGKSILEMDIIHPDNLARAAENMTRLFERHEIITDEARLLRKDGEEVVVEITAAPLLDEEGKVVSIFTIARDITERKKVEEALYLEREQLLSIFDGINEAIYVTDPGTYEILFANRYLKDAFDKELVGGICYREFQGFDAPCDFCTNDIILADKGEPYRWEYHNPVLDRHYTITDRIIRWPDGREVRFELAVDITEQKKAEEEIKGSEAKYRGLIEGLRGAIYSMSLPDGEYKYLSPSIKDVFGYAAGEFMHNPMLIREIVHPDFREYFTEKWADLIKGKVPPTYEYMIIDSQGSERWIWQSNRGVFDERGDIIAIEGLCTDITERKLAEEELKKYREHLEELVEERTASLEEKNAELEAFAYSISHDLRAPLRAMQGFSRALQEDYAEQLDEKGKNYTERVVSAAERMDSLIGDLLDYSRITRSELTLGPVDFDDVVEDTLQQLDAEIQEKEAVVTVKGPLPLVKAHYTTLLQVVANLVSNAVTFVAPGVKPEVVIGCEERGDWLRLRVEDNGIGIAPQYRERIFRIFERLHGVETYPGTGIGLAVVSKGMERMGGRAGVESEEGKGSEFWIELPKGEERNEQGEPDDIIG